MSNLMSWKQEAKEVIQSYYGGYCSMCERLGINPVPYHQFTLREYDRVKQQLKG